MPTIQATTLTAPALLLPACPPQPARPAQTQSVKQQEPACNDSVAVQTVKKGSATASMASTLLTLPTEAIKASDSVNHIAHAMQARAALQTGGLTGMAVTSAAVGTSTLAKGTQVISKLANGIMQVPVIGRLTQPQVANTVSTKVMPSLNALGASIGVYDNVRRYNKATAQGNTTARVVSSVQIGLNSVSGVTGFLKGKGQVISAVAGISSLALEGITHFTGFGKVK